MNTVSRQTAFAFAYNNHIHMDASKSIIAKANLPWWRALLQLEGGGDLMINVVDVSEDEDDNDDDDDNPSTRTKVVLNKCYSKD